MKKAGIFWLLFPCAVLATLRASKGLAQKFTASIVGTITDERGGILPGVTVVAENIETRLTRTGLTNDSGNYSISQLPPGEYRISTSLAGFKKEVRTGVILQVGWEIAGIATLQSGRPYTPYVSTDNSNTGNFLDRPNLIGNPRLDHPTPELWVNKSAFAMPSQFAFGNAGRNILVGDGLVNFDFALMRNIRYRENKTLQFRAESFNAFNHPNFALPVPTFDSARFGTVPSTSTDPRDIQFGVKIIF